MALQLAVVPLEVNVIGIAWKSEMTLLDYMVPLQISDFGMTREVECTICLAKVP